MKKAILFIVISLFILFPVFTLAADDESDVILQAQMDAKTDGARYHASLWGVAGCVIPWWVFSTMANITPPNVNSDTFLVLGTPVITGVGIALVGYFTGEAKVPDWRTKLIQNQYEDQDVLLLYESEYTKILTKIQRCKRGNTALIGLGVGVTSFMVIGIIFVAALLGP
jgi:hypothetical protein